MFGNVGGGIVAEMAMPAEDALLEAPGSANVVLEELEIVVGFEEQHVSGSDSLERKFCGATEICEKPDVDEGCSDQEPHGVLRVVRDRERFNFNVSKPERCACGKQAAIEFGCELFLERLLGWAVAVNRYAKPGTELDQALDMI
jgi:hypothetical protein